MFYKFFDKKTSAALANKFAASGILIKNFAGSGIKNENMSDQQLAEELHKPLIRTFNKRKVHSSFTDKIWGGDLADMQLISKYIKGIRFVLCVIDISSKYT